MVNRGVYKPIRILVLFAANVFIDHFFKLSFWLSVAQVVFGGALVFLAGVLIGSA